MMYLPVLLCGLIVHTASEVCNKYCDGVPANQLHEKLVLTAIERSGRLMAMYGQRDGDLVFGHIANGQPGDELWIERSWDFGVTHGNSLGKVQISEGATESTTNAYNIIERENNTVKINIGLIRLCASLKGQDEKPCTKYFRLPICNELCDGSDRHSVTAPVILVQSDHRNRRVEVISSQYDRIVYGHLYNAVPGDKIWLDRSWNGGEYGWNKDGPISESEVLKGSTEAFTAVYNNDHRAGTYLLGRIRVCIQTKDGSNHCTDWTLPPICNQLCDLVQPKFLSDPKVFSKTPTSGSKAIIELVVSAPENAAFGRVVGDDRASALWLDRVFEESNTSLGYLGYKGAGALYTTVLNLDSSRPVHLAGKVRACGNLSGYSSTICTEWAMSRDLRPKIRQVDFDTCIESIIDHMKNRGDHLFSHLTANEASFKFKQMFCKDYGQVGNCNKCFKEVFGSLRH